MGHPEAASPSLQAGEGVQHVSVGSLDIHGAPMVLQDPSRSRVAHWFQTKTLSKQNMHSSVPTRGSSRSLWGAGERGGPLDTPLALLGISPQKPRVLQAAGSPEPLGLPCFTG